MTPEEKAERAERRHEARRRNVLREVTDASMCGLTYNELAADLGVLPESLWRRILRFDLGDEVRRYYPRPKCTRRPEAPRGATLPTGRLCHKGHPLYARATTNQWPRCYECERVRRAAKRAAMSLARAWAA